MNSHFVCFSRTGKCPLWSRTRSSTLRPLSTIWRCCAFTSRSSSSPTLFLSASQTRTRTWWVSAPGSPAGVDSTKVGEVFKKMFLHIPLFSVYILSFNGRQFSNTKSPFWKLKFFLNMGSKWPEFILQYFRIWIHIKEKVHRKKPIPKPFS